MKYQLKRLKLRWYRSVSYIIEILVKIWLLKGRSLLSFFNECYPNFILQKKQFIENSKGKVIIFFTFRTLHFIDWFAPIHLALKRDFTEKYEIIYIDFSTTLHRIGNGFEYILFRKQVEERLTNLKISNLSHFSHEEVADYDSFPKPSVIITCESIRQECFSAKERIYLPHYLLPKANEIDLPSNIRFNHVFVPSKHPYTYKKLNQNLNTNTKLHMVGYPKLCTVTSQNDCFPNSKLPVVLYAPSLDLKLIFGALGRGILQIFKDIKFCNFLIKLHPSLASRRHYINSFLHEKIQFEKHIKIDDISGIQSLAMASSIMIADFGSMGSEYRLRFGKRVIYLKTPQKYEGGPDLIFRDKFADAICEVEDLQSIIYSVLEKGTLSKSDLEFMRTQVLSFVGKSDEKAAECIHEICSEK